MPTDRLRRQLIVLSAAATMLEARPALASEGLTLLPTWSVLLTLLILFAVLVPILNACLFQPILHVLDEREERIEGARRRAEDLTRQAEATLTQYEGAVREARASSESDRKEALERTQREHAATVASERKNAEEALERARQEVANALAAAQGELRSEAQDLARDVAARVLGRAL